MEKWNKTLVETLNLIHEQITFCKNIDETSMYIEMDRTDFHIEGIEWKEAVKRHIRKQHDEEVSFDEVGNQAFVFHVLPF
ncbi:hypothetical protein ABEY63_25515 [Priestia aryabhattai]|uniref:hypothetical protein n=1 Tax=Priestia aryabhattai TaxID=412384 RepID=UPI003D2CB22F